MSDWSIVLLDNGDSFFLNQLNFVIKNNRKESYFLDTAHFFFIIFFLL